MGCAKVLKQFIVSSSAISALLACIPAFAGPDPSQSSTPWPIGFYEAESAALRGGAKMPCPTDASDRAVGSQCGEASGRQVVVLAEPGDGISFVVRPEDAGANALVIRFSIPDAPGGGGQSGTLSLSVTAAAENKSFETELTLSSRYGWAYGHAGNGVALYNSPALAQANTGLANPTHLYDEIQLLSDRSLEAGDLILLTKTPASGVATIAVDFIELERVPPPQAAPAELLPITSPICGALPFDVNHTGRVFDGRDDSIYASRFNAVPGTNPFNAPSAPTLTQEKDYYSNAPDDLLQDNSPVEAVGGLSMLQLADRNFQALQTCLATATGSGYTGVWIPPGRFYMRGTLELPSGANIQGAGIWYSKLVAVDTAPPQPATFNGRSGIAGQTGNLVFTSLRGGKVSANVTLSGFSMFGNVTQRDSVDAVPGAPRPILGRFTRSTFSHLWLEHYMGGPVTNGNSSHVTFAYVRVRDTFADGLDLYGSTSDSTITHSQARSTGDDAFALWAQGGGAIQNISTGTSVSTGNTLSDSVAQLPWWGKGIALYGGRNFMVSRDTVYDTLNLPGLSVGGAFVPAGLPATDFVTGSISEIDIIRGGGNGFYPGSSGALQVGVMTENVKDVDLRDINILNPTNFGIAFQFNPTVQPPPAEGTITNVLLRDVQVVGAPICAEVVAPLTGNAEFANVCSCRNPEGAASSCPIAYKPSPAAASTFQILPAPPANTCAQAACGSFRTLRTGRAAERFGFSGRTHPSTSLSPF
jgi:hypothetical protein